MEPNLILVESEPSLSQWNSLIFGSYSHSQVKWAINDYTWQRLRVHLLGMSSRYKYTHLVRYIEEGVNQEQRRVQVTNYVNALKRGGLIEG